MQDFILYLNPNHDPSRRTTLPDAGFRRAKAEITRWDGYAPTPLINLPVAGTVRLKDESTRFGLGSFKALGGAYAVAILLTGQLGRSGGKTDSTGLAGGHYAEFTNTITIASATDGNHGRAIAWACNKFHCRCVIYIHATVSAAREAAIAALGAEVRRVPGTYDDAVRACARDAQTHGWSVVSDTSWPGYTDIPRAIMQGYRIMADEAADQWTGPPPTHVFIQAGVGGAAAAVAVQIQTRWGPGPKLIVVEPTRAACLLASAQAGRVTAVQGDLDTIMAGLACGEPSLLAWQELQHAAAAFMAIPDAAVIETMRLLAAHGIVSGESGAAGLAAWRLALADQAAREVLGLDANSRILAFSTEGATDPELYARLTA